MKYPYHIYIPTRGRVEKQTTVEKLPKYLHKIITLVCPADEVDALKANYPSVSVLAQPASVKSIAKKRAWIAEYAYEQEDPFWFQMDDDLNFFIWLEDKQKHTSLVNAPSETKIFFRGTLTGLIQDYPCVGFGTKGFALPGGVRKNYHLGFVFGFEKELAKTIEWGRVRFYEDIDYTLQVLRSGAEIGITYDCTVEQRKADAPGGISDERTPELAEKALEKLISLHPGLVQRKPPSGQHPYSNTKVSWAKAAAMAKTSKAKSIF